MYEDRKYSFNWLNLFIKVLIFVIFALLSLWLVSKIILKNNADSKERFQNNLQHMKEVSREYFVSDNLPSSVGDKKRITLQEMYNNKLLLQLTDEYGNTCDSKESYSEATKMDKYYTLRIELTCSKMKNYIYTIIVK